MTKQIGMFPRFQVRAWKEYLSFLAGDNKANRAHPEILGSPRVSVSETVSKFRFLGNPG
jgi:hypothetical protein